MNTKLIKNLSVLICVLASLAGCAKEEDELAIPASLTTDVSVVAVPLAVDVIGVQTIHPPGIQANPGLDGASIQVTSEAVPLVNSVEEKLELADLTERIYLQWNEALTKFRAQHNRLPGNLQELAQFQPELAALKIPRGFQLQFDKQDGEIYVTHAAPSRPHQPPPQTVVLPPPATFR